MLLPPVHGGPSPRKKIKEMSDDELRAFLAEGSDEHEEVEDLLDFYSEFRE